jgi:hypothetical protein
MSPTGHRRGRAKRTRVMSGVIHKNPGERVRGTKTEAADVRQHIVRTDLGPRCWFSVRSLDGRMRSSNSAEHAYCVRATRTRDAHLLATTER